MGEGTYIHVMRMCVREVNHGVGERPECEGGNGFLRAVQRLYFRKPFKKTLLKPK